MKNLNRSACGVRLRFRTNSERIIFKVKFNRKWSYLKMVNWGSMGFDVYKIINDEYFHRTVFGPTNGKDTFAEIIYENPNSELCIFLPNYNKIEEFYMGIEKGSTIEKVDSPENKKLPIVFYGNSVTQGAAASAILIALRKLPSLSPTYFPIILPMSSFSKGVLNNAADAFAHSDFPQPGIPTINTPLGIETPNS